MPALTGPGSRPRKVYDQPQEGLPSADFDLKIRDLEVLHKKVEWARADYRSCPTPANESTLRKLNAQADALYCDIAFGIAPKVGG
jgi:hypothetical protein